MERTFIEWMNDDFVIIVQNESTGKFKKFISPKRGNETYANNKIRMAYKIKKGLDKLELDRPVKGMRSSLVMETFLLLVTLTFDQKLISKAESWYSLTSKGQAFNRFSANLSKIFGSKATFKVKEGTLSGYPAPHVLVLVDVPVRCFKYKGKWRIQSRSIVERIKKVWPYGFVDVEAVVSNKVGKRHVVYYMTKYMMKTVEPYSEEVIPCSKEYKKQRIAIQTHIWNKFFGCRDVLSKAFKQRLNTLRSSYLESSDNWSLFCANYASAPPSLRFYKFKENFGKASSFG